MRERDKALLRSRWRELSRISCAQRLLQLYEPQVKPPRLADPRGVARAQGVTPPSMEQPQYNLFVRKKVEREFAPLYRMMGLGTTIWSPLASGLLTGKYSNGIPADSRMNLPGYEWLKAQSETAEGRKQIDGVRKLAAFAKTLGMPVHHLALLWCLANPNVSMVILGASKKSQLEDNLSLKDKGKLTPDVLAEIDAMLGNRPPAPERY
jgi:aryl-alcohol dehydrogenase-like predicted oxidoreductase